MKTIYKFNQQFSIDDEIWEDISCWSYYHYIDEQIVQDLTKVISIHNYEELRNAVELHNIQNASIETTMFRKREYIKLNSVERNVPLRIYADKNYPINTIKIRKTIIPVGQTWSIIDVAKKIPYDEFIEFLQDHEIFIK